MEVSIQSSSSLEALAGEEEPAEDQWWQEKKSLQEAGTLEESPFENSSKARPW